METTEVVDGQERTITRVKDVPPYKPRSERCYGDLAIDEYREAHDDKDGLHVYLVRNPEAQ